MADTTCPVCNSVAQLLDVVDFNKSCEEARGKFLPLTGRSIYYASCASCGFVFAPEMHQWSAQEFAQHVYNDAYIDVDPDYAEARPAANAAALADMFKGKSNGIRHLDFGAGQGLLSAKLAAKGWNSSAYDPFVNTTTALSSLGKFHLITAYEVFEHSPDVQKLMKDIKSLLADDGIVLFSTLLSDQQITPNARLNWWYAAPRNGHISLFNGQSLHLLALQHGLQLGSFSAGFHVLFTKPPSWALHLFDAPEAMA
ncbi:MAG: class I SAM-dependent methyltransferase [Betaproteobacteria bacterium]|jgi:SAM-dependent methyltransferase